MRRRRALFEAMPFDIVYSPEALDHLEELRASDQRRVLDSVDRELRHTPLTPTRNRKPMRSNRIATWELRVGDFRIYYDPDADTQTVNIRAVGIKRRNRVTISGEEVELS